MSDLFQPFQLGPITLANRVVMAPLTRSRAEAGNVPGPLTVEYYTQRATIGLIIAEATQVSATAQSLSQSSSEQAASVIASSPIHTIFVIGFRIVYILSGCGVGRL